MKIKVVALDTYEKFNVTDNELGRIPKEGESFEVTQERLNVLMGNNSQGRTYVKIVEPVREESKAILPKKDFKRKNK